MDELLVQRMRGSPQPWTVASILENGFGEVVAHTKNTACLRAGHFYFVEGAPDAALANAMLESMGEDAVIISSEEGWLQWFLLHPGSYDAERATRWRYSYAGSAPVLPAIPGIEVRPITPELHAALQPLPWAEGVFDSYRDTEDYFLHGFGRAAMCDGHPVSLCTSFSHSRLGVEIEVDTDPQYRGRGLARLVSAHFIMESLQRGYRPLWDASNPPSARVAERLGFSLEHIYTAVSLHRVP